MSGSLAKGFLADIVANIDDDAPRLIYADWLDEHGQPERAEFIRVQVRRARLPAWDAAQVRLRLREEELLKQHAASWLKELPAIKGVTWEGFRRGLVAEVSFASFEAMRQSAAACQAVAPVEAVTVHWPRRKEGKKAAPPIAELRELTLTGRPYEDEVAWLADSPQLATLHTLTTIGLSAEDLRRLVASPHLAGLRALRLESNGVGVAGVRALTEVAALDSLEELDLSGPGYFEQYYEDPIINAAGMVALAGWPGLARVRRLALSGSDIRPAGLRALLRSPHAGALRELSLRKGRLDGQAMGEFREARRDLRLEVLDLGENVLKEVGAEYLALAPCLGELKVLRLDGCDIPLTGARILAKKAAFLDGLRVLDVSHNRFGPAGLGALLEREPPSLHSLQIRDNDLFVTGAEALAGSPASDTLLELDLGHNALGDAAATALGESKHLRGLLVLRLRENRISLSAVTALSASSLGRRLAVLELVAHDIPF
jgi:uncharacterized protein (TIGR02996 family)